MEILLKKVIVNLLTTITKFLPLKAGYNVISENVQVQNFASQPVINFKTWQKHWKYKLLQRYTKFFAI